MGWEQYHQNVQYRIMYSKNFSMPDIIVISTAQSQEKSEEKLSFREKYWNFVFDEILVNVSVETVQGILILCVVSVPNVGLKLSGLGV